MTAGYMLFDSSSLTLQYFINADERPVLEDVQYKYTQVDAPNSLHLQSSFSSCIAADCVASETCI